MSTTGIRQANKQQFCSSELICYVYNTSSFDEVAVVRVGSALFSIFLLDKGGEVIGDFPM